MLVNIVKNGKKAIITDRRTGQELYVNTRELMHTLNEVLGLPNPKHTFKTVRKQYKNKNK